VTGISTHVLDTALGLPAEGVPVELAVREADGRWRRLAGSATDADGRCRDLPAVEAAPADAGYGPPVFRLLFDTGAYHRALGAAQPFFPEVSIVFTLSADQPHYHVPLLLNPYGYTVYRGS
jgi:5-hydroxyisourate hydrolase